MAVIKIVGHDVHEWITDVKEVKLILPRNAEEHDMITCDSTSDGPVWFNFPTWVHKRIAEMDLDPFTLSFVKHPWWPLKDEKKYNPVFLLVTFNDGSYEVHNMASLGAFLMNDQGQTIDRF